MAFTNTYYINPDNTGTPRDGSTGNPYNWSDVRGAFESNTEYLILQGTTTTIGADSANGWLNLTGLTNVKFGIWESGGSTKPIIDGLKDIGANTWTEVNDSDVPASGTNKWRTPHSHVSGGANLDRVFFDKVGQIRGSAISDLSTTVRCYKKTGYIYVYSTTNPGTGGGSIDGVSTTIESFYDIELINIAAADQIFVDNIEFWGNEVIAISPITANITQIEFTNFVNRYISINKTAINIQSDSTYNISGVLVDNCTFDLHIQEGESGWPHARGSVVDNGTSNAIHCKGQTGPSTGGSAGDGLWVKNSAFNGFSHSAIRAKAAKVGPPYDDWWTRCVLIENCTFDFTNTGHGRAFDIGDSNCEVITVRNLYIYKSRSGAEIGSSGGEYYNIIVDTPLDDLTDGDSQRSGAFELYTNNLQGGTVENNDIHSWTIANAEGNAITFHTGGMQSGTGNTIRNMLFVNCADDHPVSATHDGICIWLQGTYTQMQTITWSNLVFYSDTYSYNDSTDPIIYVDNASEVQTQYTLSDIGSGGVANFSSVYCTDPGLNETTFAISNTGSAYNAGYNVGTSYDYNNDQRPGAGDSSSAYDIGAVEYQDTSAAPVAGGSFRYSMRRKIVR